MREHRQHRHILDKHFCDKFAQSCSERYGAEMVHQDRAETLTLVGVDDSKSNFCFLWLHDNKPCAADDRTVSIFVGHSDKCNMVHKVNSQEVIDLLVSQFLSRGKEPSEHRSGTGTRYCRKHRGAIVWADGADLDQPSIAQLLDSSIGSKICHG